MIGWATDLLIGLMNEWMNEEITDYMTEVMPEWINE